MKLIKFLKHLILALVIALLIMGLDFMFLNRAVNSIKEHREIAVIFNKADQLSIRIARYYKEQRGIPAENMIGVELKSRGSIIPPEEFMQLKREVDAKTPDNVQFYVVVWANPYRVGCMSITSAFTFGYDRSYCAEGCAVTKPSPYFNSDSNLPYQDFGMRPTMVIPVVDYIKTRALIDRGIAADQSFPKGTAYLLSTSDAARNVRAAIYPKVVEYLSNLFNIEIIKSDTLENKKDVMFYFTGLIEVKKIKTNHFLPGAIADHLTSFGGALTDSSQMSSLKWLEAGATGSYGTVQEPCNFIQKFPNPGILMLYYLKGDRLIEAYWKSVSQPGQGIFIGEPLARPFKAE